MNGFSAGQGGLLVSLACATAFSYLLSVRLLRSLMRSVAVEQALSILKERMGGTLQGTYTVMGPSGIPESVPVDNPRSLIEKGYLVVPGNELTSDEPEEDESGKSETSSDADESSADESSQ